MNLWESRNWTPMLLKEIDKPFDANDYLFEIKFDGIRACIIVSPTSFKIINRHHKDITRMYPELKEIQKLVNKETIFDGEIVIMENGMPSFSKLQERSHLKDKRKIKNASVNNPVVFVCFDILYEKGNLIDLPLITRKQYLEKIKENEVFIKSRVFSEGKKLFQKIKKLNMEGIVAKKKNSLYLVNKRDDAWLKIKNFCQEEFFIGGYEEKKGYVISLLLGEYHNNEFIYVGNVMLAKKSSLYNKIISLKVKKTSPFKDYSSQNVNFINPSLTCLVHYMQRTKNNHLRQPFIKNNKL